MTSVKENWPSCAENLISIKKNAAKRRFRGAEWPICSNRPRVADGAGGTPCLALNSSFPPQRSIGGKAIIKRTMTAPTTVAAPSSALSLQVSWPVLRLVLFMTGLLVRPDHRYARREIRSVHILTLGGARRGGA
jgi:hypothetical protein